MRIRLLACALAAVPLLSRATSAQQASNPLNFSGVLFTNYQYRTDLGPSENFNKFDVERAYLNFRMPAGDNASIRVTTDVFQQTNTANNGYYGGWVIRAKYAFLQYDYLKSTNWTAVARMGMLHTVIIDWEEQFWPRWISLTPVERAGFFSSADAGIATLVTLPNKWGEAYATITNGEGYNNLETNRFKDYAARVSFTPLANGSVDLLKTFTITPWYYKGTTPDKIAGVFSGLRRDRMGVFLGLRDPRLGAGFDYMRNTETGESGTTPATRVVADSSGNLLDGWVWAKPWNQSAGALKPLGFIARYDKVTPRGDASATAGFPAEYHVFIGGLTWDLNQRVGLSVDYQETLNDNSVGVGKAQTKTYFGHVVVNF